MRERTTSSKSARVIANSMAAGHDVMLIVIVKNIVDQVMLEDLETAIISLYAKGLSEHGFGDTTTKPRLESSFIP